MPKMSSKPKAHQAKETDPAGKLESDEEKTISIQMPSSHPEKADKGSPIQFNAQTTKQSGQNLSKQKVKKYKILLEGYIVWILRNIINPDSGGKCPQHDSPENKDNYRDCQDCIQVKKQERWYKSLKAMESFKHLSLQFKQQFKNLKRGQLNFRNLAKILGELNLWLKLLGSSYFNWRVKEKYSEIEKFIIKCLEKIVKYKDLRAEFGELIQKTKEQNKKNWNQQTNCRSTRSGRGSKREVDYEQVLLNSSNLKMTKNTNVKRNHKKIMVNQVKQEFNPFLAMLERDQMCTNFKIIILRDVANLGTFKVLDKEEYIKERKKKQINIAVKKEEHQQICETDDQQDHCCESSLEWQVQRIIKKNKLNKIQQEYIQQEQNRLRNQQQIQTDLQFLGRYSMRSNTLVIEKYHQKLQLDWQKKWQVAFSPSPQILQF